MKRSKHNLSHYRMHTAKMGEVFPIACVPVVPGDTFQHGTSMLVRAAPLNTPVMHPVQIRVHHFFCPNRMLWSGWEDFITGGPDGNDASEIPVIAGPNSKKNLFTYLGVPNVTGASSNSFNALPVRAYNRIINEYYRDQDLVAERAVGDTSLARCAWEKDYFTTSRPWTQKGPAVTVPVGESAPVVTDLSVPTFNEIGSGANLGNLQANPSAGDVNGLKVQNNPSQLTDVRFGGNTGLIADLAGATGVDVNQFREAFAIQRYQEARSRYGSRFTEYLRYLGITPSDARLQRPEYLGGGTSRLQFSEVLQTSPGEEGEAGVGDLYGHGIAGVKAPKYRSFFEEHGFVLTLCSVRPRATYLNAVPREFLKTTKEDYFQKELVHLGQQAVDAREVNAANEASEWGFQDRYDEYRQHYSQVGQDFRDTLSSWHLGRDIPVDQALNDDFVECTPSDRIFQVETGDNLWIMANHRIVARRLVPKRARPRIL